MEIENVVLIKTQRLFGIVT